MKEKYEISTEVENLTLSKESLKERSLHLLSQPDYIEEIYDAMCLGASLATFAETRRIRYVDLAKFVDKKENRKVYMQALDMRRKFVIDKLTDETLKIGVSDIRRLYGENGCLLKPHEWPSDIAGAVESVETKELFENDRGTKIWVGNTVKVKFNNKLKAIQMHGQEQGIFKEKKEIDVGETLADIIQRSWKKGEEETED